MEKVQDAEPKCFVYGLVDPETRLVFYIGQSTVGMKRPNEHRKKGWKFDVAILEEVAAPRAIVEGVCHWLGIKNPTALHESERYWIAYGRACGWPLLNKTEGGDGVRGTPETIERMSRAHQGRKHSLESRERIRAAILKRMLDPTANLGSVGMERKPRKPRPRKARGPRPPMTAETRAAISARMTGRVVSAETRARISAALTAPETKERLSLLRSMPKALKTHCKHGHPYDGANAYWHKGKRQCRACAAQASATWRERQRLR